VDAVEFRETLEYVGLSPEWFAQYAKTDQKRVSAWLDGSEDIPNAYAHVADELKLGSDQQFGEECSRLRESPRLEYFIPRTDADSNLRPYNRGWPASWYVAIAARLCEEFPGLRVGQVP